MRLNKAVITSLILMSCSCSVYAGDFVTPKPAEQNVAGSIIGAIKVQGNQRIENATVISYLNLKEGDKFSSSDIDAALKSIFATGFFSDATIVPHSSGGKVDLVVEVVENPIVDKVGFEGNDALEEKDLQGELELKTRATYTKTKLQSDVKRVLDLYRRSGRYSAQVTPKIIQLDQNRVDLVYEIIEGPVARVQKIAFIGNENFEADKLAKIIRTEESRWYKFLTSDDKYDSERLQYDQELLRRFYASEGFADFQVKSAIAELSPAKDAFYLTFAIEEGQKYNFGKVNIESALKGADISEVEKNLLTKPDTIYNATAVESSIDALTKELGNQGFAFVNIEPKLNRNPEQKIIDLTYDIKEGPRVYVEKINIIGNVRTLDEVVRRELRLAEGDPYSTAKIARSEQRLNNLGFFDKVKISSEQGTSPDKTVINVEIKEKSTGEISLGGGFSTTDGALAQFGVKETNLLGRGQDLRFNATLSTNRQQYDIGFTEPYFLDRELAAGFDLFKTQTYTNIGIPYQEDTNGVRFRLGYALSEKWQHTLNYTFKQTDINNIQAGASRFIVEQAGKTTESSVGHTIAYDNRDNKQFPTSGEFASLTQDVAGVGGDAHYLRNEGRAAYYYPVAPKWTFALKGIGGYIAGFGEDVRIADRFFLGGNSFRGFEPFGVGPHDSDTGDSLGGNVYYTVTPELTFPLGLPDDLGFAGSIFADAGSLWKVEDTGPMVNAPTALRLSAGAGVSWASPFGPIRIDLAKAIKKDQYDKTQIFQFNFGTRF